MEKVVRIRDWQAFKSLAVNLKPNSIVYIIEQNGFSPEKELTCLRLIMPTQEAYYIFLDFPFENRLRETGILIRKDRRGIRYLEEKDIVAFLKAQMQREDLTVCSYWTI